MGILNRKNKVAKTQQQDTNNVLNDFMRSFDNVTPVKSKYEIIEEAIANNPKSSLYRVETQQTSVHLHTIEVSDFMAKSKKGFIALDLETTGLDNVEDAIVEIGAVRVRNGAIVEYYHQFIDPEKPMPQSAYEVNGITDAMLCGQPQIYEVMPDLLDFIGNDIVAAHNVSFDAGFLIQACMRYRFKIHRKYFDTMDLKVYWPGVKNRKLSTFLEAAGIQNNNSHRADGDAEALARFIIKTCEKVNSIE